MAITTYKINDDLIRKANANKAKVNSVVRPLNRSASNGFNFADTYRSKVGFNQKDLPTYRPDRPAPKGIGHLFDIFNKVNSGAMYALQEGGKRQQNYNPAQRFLSTGVGLPLTAAKYAKDFYTGISGDINYTGKSTISNWLDNPQARQELANAPRIQRVLDNNNFRSTAGFGLEVLGDPTNIIPVGVATKPIKALSKATGLTDNLVNPAIRGLRNTDTVFSIENRLGRLLPEGYKGLKNTRGIELGASSEVQGAIFDLFKNKASARKINDLKLYAAAATRDLGPEVAKQFSDQLDDAVKVADKLGKDLDLKLAQRYFMDAVPAAERVADYETLIKPFRFLEDTKVTTGLVKSGVISAETAAKDPSYGRQLFGGLNDEVGSIEELGLTAKGSTKMGPEISLSMMKKSDYLRAIESLRDRSDKAAQKIVNAFDTQVKNSGSLSEMNKVADSLSEQIQKVLPGEQLRLAAYDQKVARGLIEDASITISKTIGQGLDRITNETFLKQVADNFVLADDAVANAGKRVARIPNSPRYGALAGQLVEKPIYDDIVGLLGKDGEFLKNLKKVTNLWKQVKLFSPLNFASNSRNQIGDMVLNSMVEDGPSLAKQFTLLPKAVKEWESQGKLYQELLEKGVFSNTYAAQEATTELQKAVGRAGQDSAVDTVGRGVDAFTSKGLKTPVPGFGFGKDAYAYTSEINKMVQIMHQRSLGKSLDEAIRLSDKATFNYSALPTGITGIRDTVLPFMTFKYFAAQLMWDTLINRTSKIGKLPKAQRLIEGMNVPGQEKSQVDEQNLPDYIKEKRGMYVRLPWDTQNKLPQYLDLQYSYPFGDIAGGLNPTDVILGNPFIRTPIELARNHSFYFDREIADPLDSTGDRAKEYGKYALEQLGPKPGLRELGKVTRGVTGGADRYGRTITPGQALLDVGFGVKAREVDPQLQSRFNYYDKQEKLGEIKSQIKSVARDQSISERQREKEMMRLQDLYTKAYYSQ